MTLTLLDILVLSLALYAPAITRKLLETDFIAHRLDRAKFALACDDEANRHYNLTPSLRHRSKLVLKALRKRCD